MNNKTIFLILGMILFSFAFVDADVNTILFAQNESNPSQDIKLTATAEGKLNINLNLVNFTAGTLSLNGTPISDWGDIPNFLKKDGSTALTAAWFYGSEDISGSGDINTTGSVNGLLGNFTNITVNNLFANNTQTGSLFVTTETTDNHIQIFANDDTDGKLVMSGANGIPQLRMVKSSGSRLSPDYLPDGSAFAVLLGYSFNEVGGQTFPGVNGDYTNNAILRFQADGTHSSGDTPSKFEVLTSTGSATLLGLRIDKDQNSLFGGDVYSDKFYDSSNSLGMDFGAGTINFGDGTDIMSLDISSSLIIMNEDVNMAGNAIGSNSMELTFSSGLALFDFFGTDVLKLDVFGGDATFVNTVNPMNIITFGNYELTRDDKQYEAGVGGDIGYGFDGSNGFITSNDITANDNFSIDNFDNVFIDTLTNVDMLTVGSNTEIVNATITLSSGDINADNIYADGYFGKSPFYIGQDSEVGYTRLCVKDVLGFMNMVYWNDGVEVLQKNNRRCNDKKTRLDNDKVKDEELRVLANTCISQNYSWDNKNKNCFEEVRQTKTKAGFFAVFMVKEMQTIDSNCTMLDKNLDEILKPCTIEVPTGSMIAEKRIKDNCGWNEDQGYYCDVKNIIIV